MESTQTWMCPSLGVLLQVLLLLLLVFPHLLLDLNPKKQKKQTTHNTPKRFVYKTHLRPPNLQQLAGFFPTFCTFAST